MDVRTQVRNAAAGAADSLWRAARRRIVPPAEPEPRASSKAESEPLAAMAPVFPMTKPEPYRHISGRWACCGGYGEHFTSCEFATWERRA